MKWEMDEHGWARCPFCGEHDKMHFAVLAFDEKGDVVVTLQGVSMLNGKFLTHLIAQRACVECWESAMTRCLWEPQGVSI